jgi:beta-glucosidase
MELYRDQNQPLDMRIQDLLGRMSVDEKLAQMGSLYASTLMQKDVFSPDLAASMMPQGIGHISATARSSDLAGRELAEFTNAIQRYLKEKTRLGIPAIIHEECLNGFRAKGATIFPQNIGLASTWDSDLVNRITTTIRRQMRATGMHQGLAPVLDVARDPRWGRIEETFGEEPFLVGEMGTAYVKGLQGPDLTRGIAATLKHFAGHGLPEGGLNCAPANIPPRLLRDVYLYPFKKAVREGGAASVMNAYHEIDGVPCAASEELLTGILREEWGFSGVVVSDYYAIAQLMTSHHVCDNSSRAAELALTAGIDIELPRTDCYNGPLKELVEKGAVPISLVDRAAGRILRMKFILGLFENPFVDPVRSPLEIDTSDDRQLAREAARKSIVLLKNEHSILPLTERCKKIAVIGPSADSQRNLLGDYTYPSGTGYEIESDSQSGEVKVSWKPGYDRTEAVNTPPVISILQGIRERAPQMVNILYAKGCEFNDNNRNGFNQAVATAAAADVAVVVVGGQSGLLPDCTCGEMRDRAELALPGVQERLIKAVYESGTPVVLVLIDGRPQALKWMADSLPGIIEAWLPGEEGGRAVGEVLFGDYNPGGKLAVSFPEKEGQIPLFAAHKPTGSRSSVWGNYVDSSVQPRFEFGYGLSYTTFKIRDLKIAPDVVKPDGRVNIQVTIENTGQLAGDEVVQLYINDEVASLTRPVKELKGFQRVHLLPGQKETVEFSLPVSNLGFHAKDLKYRVEPGYFRVMVGSSSRDIRQEGRFKVEQQPKN